MKYNFYPESSDLSAMESSIPFDHQNDTRFEFEKQEGSRFKFPLILRIDWASSSLMHRKDASRKHARRYPVVPSHATGSLNIMRLALHPKNRTPYPFQLPDSGLRNP